MATKPLWIPMILLLAPVAALACRIDGPVLLPERFDTIATAMAAVEARYGRQWLRSDTEHAGVVYRVPGGYEVSAGPGCPGADSFELRVTGHPRGTPVALWHSHGRSGLFRHLFSDADARLVADTGWPLYLIAPDRSLRVLTPAHVAGGRIERRRGPGSLLRSGGYTGDLVQKLIGATSR